MRKVLCYIIKDYDNIDYYETLEILVTELKNSGSSAYYCNKHLPVRVVYSDNTTEKVSLADFINVRILPLREIEDISNQIELRIQEQEKEDKAMQEHIRAGLPVSYSTGCMPIYYRKNKQDLIDKEIAMRSLVWK